MFISSCHQAVFIWTDVDAALYVEWLQACVQSIALPMYVGVKDFARRFQKHLCYVQCCFCTKWFRPLHFAGFGVGAEELAGHRCFSKAWGLPIWQQQEHPRTMHVHMLGRFGLFVKLFCNESSWKLFLHGIYCNLHSSVCDFWWRNLTGYTLQVILLYRWVSMLE